MLSFYLIIFQRQSHFHFF